MINGTALLDVNVLVAFLWTEHSLRYTHRPKQLTDRYLLALAAAHDGTLATFDRAVRAGLPADSPLLAHLDVIPG